MGDAGTVGVNRDEKEFFLDQRKELLMADNGTVIRCETDMFPVTILLCYLFIHLSTVEPTSGGV